MSPFTLRTRMREGLRFVVIVLVALAVTGSQALSQAPQIERGTRLRITIPCPRPSRSPCTTTGELISLGDDAITLSSGESTQTYALADASRAEVSVGVRSFRLVGAAVGAVILAGVTYAVLQDGGSSGGSTAVCNQSKNQDALDAGDCVKLYVLGGLAGAGLGVLVGGFIRTERWQDVALGSLRISIEPQIGRLLGVTARVRF